MGVTQTILQRMEKNMLKWRGHVGTEDNRRPQQITTWSPGRRGRTVNWVKEVGSVMKQKNLTNDDAINWQLWQKVMGGSLTGGPVQNRLIDRLNDRYLGRWIQRTDRQMDGQVGRQTDR